MNVDVDFSTLNDQQREAVEAIHGPVLVLAGAGTGKTRVITYRTANLLSQNVPPGDILAVTFTKKAAGEMQERVTQLVGRAARKMRISTFHSLGFSILREQYHHVGLSSGFEICSQYEQRIAIAERVIVSLQLQDLVDAPDLLRRISLAKNHGRDAEQLAKSTHDMEQLLGRSMLRYDAELRDANLVDLDDLVTLPLQILREHRAARETYQARYRYMMIDEYQDTNKPQHDLTMLMLGAENNLCVVGDDDQAIYGFRGAVVANIREFAFEFPNTRVITLTQNYRSSEQILDFANAVISPASGRLNKELQSQCGRVAPVEVQTTRSDDEECRFIAGRIKELSSSTKLADMAVLLRVNNQTKPLKEELDRAGIPHGAKKQGVRVLTLHASKGLEFPVVFVPGLEEDTLPHWNAVRSGPDAVEEERRLFYVGATRARNRLIVSSARTRANHSKAPSRFLSGLASREFVTHRVSA